MTRNQLQYWSNVETERSNLRREKESERSNRAQEKLKGRDQDLKVEDQKLTKRGQNISMINAGIQTLGKVATSFIPTRGFKGATNKDWSSMSDSAKRDMINKF